MFRHRHSLNSRKLKVLSFSASRSPPRQWSSECLLGPPPGKARESTDAGKRFRTCEPNQLHLTVHRPSQCSARMMHATILAHLQRERRKTQTQHIHLPTSDLPTYRPTDLPTYRPTDLPTYRPTDLPTYRPTDLPTYRPTDLPTYRRTDLPIYRPTDLPTYRPTDLPTYRPTDLPTYRPTDLPTYLPTDPPTHRRTDPPTPDPPTNRPTDLPDLPTYRPTRPADLPTYRPTDPPYLPTCQPPYLSADLEDSSLTCRRCQPRKCRNPEECMLHDPLVEWSFHSVSGWGCWWFRVWA